MFACKLFLLDYFAANWPALNHTREEMRCSISKGNAGISKSFPLKTYNWYAPAILLM